MLFRSNDTATTEIYTLSLHDALPISNDAHYFQNGKWSFVNREKNIIEILDSSGAAYKKFQVIELKQDLLKFVGVN